jgi:hypothetical protein
MASLIFSWSFFWRLSLSSFEFGGGREAGPSNGGSSPIVWSITWANDFCEDVSPDGLCSGGSFSAAAAADTDDRKSAGKALAAIIRTS